MKHARPDYQDRIEDKARKIPKDEPVFLIRGQDSVGAEAVEFYATLYSRQRGHDPRIVKLVRDHAEAMRRWPKKKIADLPKKKRR